VTWLRVLSSRLPARRVRVGSLGPHDARRLSDIHGSAFARPWGTDEFEAFLTERNIVAQGLFLGRAREPDGFVVSRRVLDEAEILSVALARTARGRGYSRILLAHHLDSLAEIGVAHVHLEVEEGNGPAIALYRGHGFVESGRRPDYYLRPNGTRAAALSMTRHLAPAIRAWQPDAALP
jgi:ribosomal-protein-alanine N-acetyltransferase